VGDFPGTLSAMHPLTLPARVQALESDVHQLQHAAEAHTEAHALTDTKLDDLSGQVRALAHQVRAEVVPSLARLEGDVAELKGDVAELKGDVAELKGDVAELKAGVGALLEHFQITPPAPPGAP
jgi:chromosome segregation ATPase